MIKYITDKINTIIPINLSEEEITKKKDEAIVCVFCEKLLKNDKVADHDHLTGKYRGIAHKACNLNYSFKDDQIPVFFHNLKGYDSHIIISAYMKYGKGRKIEAIAQTTEKYLSFTIGKLKFVDSYAFMASSLEMLAASMPKDKFVFLKAEMESLLQVLPENLGERIQKDEDNKVSTDKIKKMKSDIDKRINERKTTDEIDFNQDAMISSFYFEIMHFEQFLYKYI